MKLHVFTLAIHLGESSYSLILDRQINKYAIFYLAGNFVAEAHFGGGLFRNTGEDGGKSRKDLIDQLIVESKKRKLEKQKEREATIEMTEKLDSEWKDLLPLVNQHKGSKLQDPPEKNNDDYDMAVRLLKFEARGTVRAVIKLSIFYNSRT